MGGVSKAIGSVFGGGGKVKTPTITAVPTVDTAAITDAAAAERLRRQKAAGLTGTQTSDLAGALSDAQDTTARSSLLGG